MKILEDCLYMEIDITFYTCTCGVHKVGLISLNLLLCLYNVFTEYIELDWQQISFYI